MSSFGQSPLVLSSVYDEPVNRNSEFAVFHSSVKWLGNKRVHKRAE